MTESPVRIAEAQQAGGVAVVMVLEAGSPGTVAEPVESAFAPLRRPWRFRPRMGNLGSGPLVSRDMTSSNEFRGDSGDGEGGAFAVVVVVVLVLAVGGSVYVIARQRSATRPKRSSPP
jgi:hypothetical protein